MLNKQDINNLLVIIANTSFKGSEALEIVKLQQKLSLMVQEDKPNVNEHETKTK